MSAVTVDANSGRFLIVPAQNTHTVNGPKKKNVYVLVEEVGVSLVRHLNWW